MSDEKAHFFQTVKRGGWEFFIERNVNGLFVSVPDCGGMADMIPKVPEQLEWAEGVLSHVPFLKQTWPTTWEVLDETALPALEALLGQV